MFRVTGLDGSQYYAKDITELQQWVNEGRITPQMSVEDMSMARTTPAENVPGLQWPNQTQYQQPPMSQPTPLSGVDPRNVPRNQPYQSSSPYPRTGGNMNVQAPFLKAILATVCCCVPVGIVSIVYASQVSGHVARGDYLSAQQAAKNSDLWANVSIGIGAVVIVIQLVFGVIGAAAGL